MDQSEIICPDTTFPKKRTFFENVIFFILNIYGPKFYFLDGFCVPILPDSDPQHLNSIGDYSFFFDFRTLSFDDSNPRAGRYRSTVGAIRLKEAMRDLETGRYVLYPVEEVNF